MKENVNDFSKKLRELLVEEINKVIDPSTGLLKEEVSEFVDCPLCGSKKFHKFWVKDGFTYVRCQDCQFVYLNPKLNESATLEFYNGAWTNLYNQRKFFQPNPLDKKINYRNLMEISHIIRGGELLEIGCADGYFLQAARDEFGFDVFGVELNEETSQFAREKRGLDVRTTTLEEAGFPESFFDVVYMRDVFEHIQKPWKMLQEIHRILRKGGLIVIEVPNVDGLIYKFVGERHVCVFGLEHLNFFSDKTLKYILQKTGFDTIQIKMASLDFTFPSLINYFFGGPAFTTVSAPSRNVFCKVICIICSASGFILRRMNSAILPKFANILNKGSVITVYAAKR
jgi:SAM-dependent methyltransferase